MVVSKAYNDDSEILRRNAERWYSKYQEGFTWGEAPSPTATLLLNFIGAADPSKTICDVGAGYGRDIPLFVNAGYGVHAYDLASNAKDKSLPQVKSWIDSGKVSYITGDFIKHANTFMGASVYSHLFSHRMLHLLTSETLVNDFKRAVAHVVEDGAKIAISARDLRDFNKNQMRWIDKENGIAEYKNRDNHIISFWSEERFKKEFGGANSDFNVIACTQAQELESVENRGTNSHFTVMLAERKPRQSVTLNGHSNGSLTL